MTTLFEPLPLARGRPLKNRFVLAPLTNTQSHEDGTLSDDEYRWLTMRAQGGFGLTMTCASHVQAIREKGVLPIHRRSFAPVRGLLGGASDAHHVTR